MSHQTLGPFTAILIDASKERFQPDLVTAGYDGGQRAASMLKDGAHQFLQQQGMLNTASHPNPTHILIYVYADHSELGRFYTQTGALTSPSDMSSFVSGFDICSMNGQAILGDVKMESFRRQRCLDDLVNLLAADRRCMDVILASSMRGAATEMLRRRGNPLAVLAVLRYVSFPDVFRAVES